MVEFILYYFCLLLGFSFSCILFVHIFWYNWFFKLSISSTCIKISLLAFIPIPFTDLNFIHIDPLPNCNALLHFPLFRELFKLLTEISLLSRSFATAFNVLILFVFVRLVVSNKRWLLLHHQILVRLFFFGRRVVVCFFTNDYCCSLCESTPCITTSFIRYGWNFRLCVIWLDKTNKSGLHLKWSTFVGFLVSI